MSVYAVSHMIGHGYWQKKFKDGRILVRFLLLFVRHSKFSNSLQVGEVPKLVYDHKQRWSFTFKGE